MTSFNPGDIDNTVHATTSFTAVNDNAAPGENVGQHFQTFGESDPFGFANVSMSNGFVAGMSMSGALNSERYAKILKKMQELAADPNNDQNILRHVVALDKSVAPTVHFACILVAIQSKADPSKTVGFQTLIVDGTNAPLPDQESTAQDNSQISLTRFAENAWDDKLINLATSRIISIVPGAKHGNVFYTAPVVLGTEQVDANNENQIAMILSNSVLAAQSAAARFAGSLEGRPGRYFRDLNLNAEFKAKKVPELHITHQVSQESVGADEVGALTRIGMVSMLSTGKPRDRQKFSPNSEQANRVLHQVGTFTDLLPVLPMGQQQGMYTPGAFNPMTGQPMQPLLPLVVITKIKSSFALTPGAAVLGLILAANQIPTNRWAEDLRHRGNRLGSAIDFGDIGSILVNVPNPQMPGTYMPTLRASDVTFTDAVLWQLISDYIRTNPVLAIDVPVAAAQSWYLSMFAAAALPGKNQAAAQKLLYETIDTLTGGEYKKLYATQPNGQPIPLFHEQAFYMERGFWRVGDRMLPLELVDNYVAVCSYAREKRAPHLVSEYVSCKTNPHIPQIQRLRQCRRIMDEMTEGTAVYTRGVTRLLLRPEGLSMVNQALNNAGVVFHSDEQFQTTMGVNMSYAGGLANLGMMSSHLNTSLVNTGNGIGNAGAFYSF